MLPASPSPTPAICAPWAPAALLDAVEPAYPEIAIQSGAVGEAVVLVGLNPAGRVVVTRIAQSSGNAALDQTAVVAASKSRYEPAACGPHTAASSYRFIVDFDGRSARVIVAGKPWVGPS